MSITERTLPVALCLLAWVAVGVGLAVARKRGSGPATRRDRRALVGLLVQALGAGLSFGARRPLAHSPVASEAILCWLGAALAWASVWVVIQSVRVLGREWSLEARLVPGHRLVRQGPYRHVRHPIYAGVLGLLVGTGLTLTAWPALVVAIALYLVGTRLRTRIEDRLLSGAFGEEYARYAAEVPALVPRAFHRAKAHEP